MNWTWLFCWAMKESRIWLSDSQKTEWAERWEKHGSMCRKKHTVQHVESMARSSEERGRTGEGRASRGEWTESVRSWGRTEKAQEKRVQDQAFEEPQDSEAVQKSSKSKCLFWISNLSVLDFEVFNRGINMLTRIWHEYRSLIHKTKPHL